MNYEPAANIAIKTSYAMSGGAVIAGLTWNEIAAIVGIVMAVATYVTSSLITWHFKQKHFELLAEMSSEKYFSVPEE